MNSELKQSAFLVVVNDEGQYSIWPEAKEIPLGWKSEGTQDSEQQCLAHIDKAWTDMRPHSLKEGWDKQHASRSCAEFQR